MGLSKSQFDAIMREYDRKRMDAANRLDKRFAQVYEMIPEFYDVEEKIRETAFQGRPSRKTVTLGSFLTTAAMWKQPQLR